MRDAHSLYIICKTQRSTTEKVNIIFDLDTQRYAHMFLNTCICMIREEEGEEHGNDK